MLVLTRKSGESIRISDDIVVKVFEIGKNKVRIGIDAPSTVSVLRNEVYEEIQKENTLSLQGSVADFTKAAALWSGKKSRKQESLS